ncbi:hypothetical protein V6N11_054806 [Hibiscus sabdariffa]|uniref:C2 domain-containing protein n=1 Tax=Hibiscus sabdariffa TaxID=183260 RepID=A0ABR2S5W9_9ROSI
MWVRNTKKIFRITCATDISKFGGKEEDFRVDCVGHVIRKHYGMVSNDCDAESEDWFYRIEEIIDLQVEGNVFRVRIKEIDGLQGFKGEEESGTGRNQDIGGALSSATLGLRQSLPEVDVWMISLWFQTLI